MSTAAQTGCDKGIAASKGDGGTTPPAHPNLVLATCILASSLAFIDGSIVNVGLPAIGRSLGAGGDGLAWVVNAYLLPLSALILIGGAAGDRYGRRRLLISGTAIFAAASILCGLAPDLGWLLAGRIAQGAGAALLMPNSLAILGASFSGERRGQAIGIWAAAGAAMGAAGPLAGGWLIDAVSWRTIFAINLPLALGAIVLAFRSVPADAPSDGARLDWLGAALAAGGLAASTWGLTVASAAKALSAQSGAALAIGGALLVLFVVVERRKGEAAMTPLTLFASPSFNGLTLLTLLLYGALGGLMVVVPFVLIQASGYSAVAAGAALLPLPLVIALTSSTMGRIATRIGPRLPLSIGPVIVAAGCLLAMRIGGGGSYWTTTFPAMLVIAIGMAGAVAPLTTAVLASVDGRHTGVASGFNSAVARTGGLIATAIASVVLAASCDALIATFRIAAAVGAAAALAAGACAFALVRVKPAARAGG